MTDDEIIRLSDDEIEQAQRFALDVWARAHELALRFAAPGEREEIARQIDPETAPRFFLWCQITDPYGDIPDEEFPDEAYCIGRTYFLVDPSGVAIWEGDLR